MISIECRIRIHKIDRIFNTNWFFNYKFHQNHNILVLFFVWLEYFELFTILCIFIYFVDELMTVKRVKCASLSFPWEVYCSEFLYISLFDSIGFASITNDISARRINLSVHSIYINNRISVILPNYLEV